MKIRRKQLREKLQISLGLMEILEKEIHTIYIIACSDEDHDYEEEGKQALHQQRNLRKQIKTFRKFLERKR